MKSNRSSAEFRDGIVRGFDMMMLATLVAMAGLAATIMGMIHLHDRTIALAQVTWYSKFKVNADLSILKAYTGISFISTAMFAAAYWFVRKARTFWKMASDIAAITICGSVCVISAPTGVASALLDGFTISQLTPGSFFRFMLEIGSLFDKNPEIKSIWPLAAFKVSVFVGMVGIYASVYVKPLAPVRVVREA